MILTPLQVKQKQEKLTQSSKYLSNVRSKFCLGYSQNAISSYKREWINYKISSSKKSGENNLISNVSIHEFSDQHNINNSHTKLTNNEIIDDDQLTKKTNIENSNSNSTSPWRFNEDNQPNSSTKSVYSSLNQSDFNNCFLNINEDENNDFGLKSNQKIDSNDIDSKSETKNIFQILKNKNSNENQNQIKFESSCSNSFEGSEDSQTKKEQFRLLNIMSKDIFENSEYEKTNLNNNNSYANFFNNPYNKVMK